MDNSRGKRGYALSGLMCVGTLACGPDRPSGQEASDTTTGYPITTESSDAESSEGQDTETASTFNGTETDTTTSDTDDTGPADCSYRGDICGEMSVCQCSCDYSADCCECEPTLCTENVHCPPGDICEVFVEMHHTHSVCVPPACEAVGSIHAEGPAANLSDFSDVACAHSLYITGTTMIPDLLPLAALEAVLSRVVIGDNTGLTSLDGLGITHARVLEITYNEGLTSIDALTSLESIDEGFIYCNPLLPTADIEAVLAQIPGGELVEVANNGEGPC
jgi:hypothetical protein